VSPYAAAAISEDSVSYNVSYSGDAECVGSSPLIAFGGIGIESSTYSRIRARMEDFTILRGTSDLIIEMRLLGNVRGAVRPADAFRTSDFGAAPGPHSAYGSWRSD
jgi:hypothetical protein